MDHITCASESSTRTGTPASDSASASARIAARGAPGSAPAMSRAGKGSCERRRRAPACRPRRESSQRAPIRREALAQHGDVVEPVEQRQHDRRLDGDALQRRPKPAALVATISASTGSWSSTTARGWATKSPNITLCTRTPCAAITAAVAPARTTTTSMPARSSAPANSPPTPPGPSTATLMRPDRSARPGSLCPPGRPRPWRRAARRRRDPAAGGHTTAGDRARRRGGG